MSVKTSNKLQKHALVHTGIINELRPRRAKGVTKPPESGHAKQAAGTHRRSNLMWGSAKIKSA